MKSNLLRFISALCGAFVVLGVILNCVNFFCFYRPFYEHEYAKLGTAQQIGMSSEDLQRATDALLEYLKDDRQNLAFRAKIGGQEREVFNEREKLHMEDVKRLYLWAMRLGNAMLILAASFYLFAGVTKQPTRALPQSQPRR